MEEDFFLLDVPVFIPEYEKNKIYGWSTKKFKDNLWNLLKETSKGYCMYCYDSIWINNQRRGEIEHAIEKSLSRSSLSDCVPNLGIACSNCNGKYKRRGEKKQQLSEMCIEEFESDSCLKFDCKGICKKFEKIRQKYIKQRKILIQPFEPKIEDKGNVLMLQYDLLECRYIPNKRIEYTEEERNIINCHIRQFELNSLKRKNTEIERYCKNVVDVGSLLLEVDYNNLMVDILKEKLKKLDVEEAIRLCRFIYTMKISKEVAI